MSTVGMKYSPDGRPDWFACSTDALNSHMRTIIDAIITQLHDNPGVDDELRAVAERLRDRAVDFTNAFYRSIP